MNPAVAVVIYCILVFLAGALLAPWLYKLVAAAAHVWPALGPLAENPFHRFVNRSLLILGVIGLWPLLRSIGICSWKDAGLGLPDRTSRRALGRGFALGFVSLLCVSALAFAAGARSIRGDRTVEAILGQVVNAGAAALVVSVIEEALFRGALFGAMRRAFSVPIALLISSALYAIVHFFERPPAPETVGWATGLTTLGQMLRGFGDVNELVPGFFALLLAGWILGLAYERSGVLYFSIGLHAGWIFWVKFYGFFTRETPGANAWLWGSRKLIDGWAAVAVLAGVLAAVRLMHRSPAGAAPLRGSLQTQDPGSPGVGQT